MKKYYVLAYAGIAFVTMGSSVMATVAYTPPSERSQTTSSMRDLAKAGIDNRSLTINDLRRFDDGTLYQTVKEAQKSPERLGRLLDVAKGDEPTMVRILGISESHVGARENMAQAIVAHPEYLGYLKTHSADFPRTTLSLAPVLKESVADAFYSNRTAVADAAYK